MSRSGDFRGDNRQTDYFTPAHVRGVITLLCVRYVSIHIYNTGENFFSLVFIFVFFLFCYFPFIYFLSKTWINRDSMISEVIGTRTGVNVNSRRNRDSLRMTNNHNISHKVIFVVFFIVLFLLYFCV